MSTITTPPRAGISENRTTTYDYDIDGYLQSITGPATGMVVGFDYDSYGRLRTAWALAKNDPPVLVRSDPCWERDWEQERG